MGADEYLEAADGDGEGLRVPVSVGRRGSRAGREVDGERREAAGRVQERRDALEAAGVADRQLRALQVQQQVVHVVIA